MIGLLTFHNAINYGAVLQTYALQKTFCNANLPSEVIDYKCPAITSSHIIKLKDLNLPGYLIKQRTKKKFELFFEKEINHSAPLIDVADLGRYESIVVGSDQVWNMNLTDRDFLYYLENVDSRRVKKYSYAASIGDYKFTDPLTKNRVLKCLKKFKQISVREKTTFDYFEKELSEECAEKLSVHPDPVFLLSKDEWLEIAECKKRRDYILLYTIGGKREDLIKKAREKSKETGLPVIWLSDSLRKYRGIRNIRNVSPGRFVGLFANSSYVVTNSFHGTAFSIIFEKDMSVQGRCGKRIEDLLKLAGIRSVRNNGMYDVGYEMNRQRIEKRIKKASEEAKRYLEEIGYQKQKNNRIRKII